MDILSVLLRLSIHSCICWSERICHHTLDQFGEVKLALCTWLLGASVAETTFGRRCCLADRTVGVQSCRELANWQEARTAASRRLYRASTHRHHLVHRNWVDLWKRLIDSSLSIQSLQRRLLRLHIHGVIHLIINVELLVHLGGSPTMIPYKEVRPILIKILHVVPRDRERCNASIVCQHRRLGLQVRSFDAPANLTWDSSCRINNRRLSIDRPFVWAHLLTEETSVCRLIDTCASVFQRFLQSVVKSLFCFFTDQLLNALAWFIRI